MKVTKVRLTNPARLPFALSNLGNVDEIDEAIYGAAIDNSKLKSESFNDRCKLGKLIGDALMRSRHVYGKSFTVNPGQTRLREDRIVIDQVDGCGNIHNLWVFVTA